MSKIQSRCYGHVTRHPFSATPMTAEFLKSISSKELYFDDPVLSTTKDHPKDNVFQRLVGEAQRVAYSRACSSALVGEGNESDEMGDVAIWLGQGDFGPGHAEKVLLALGLDTKIVCRVTHLRLWTLNDGCRLPLRTLC